MPLVNYCRKCKTETPVGEVCPYCGGKLAHTGEQISFGVVHTPLRDWFAWNNLLRVALPALGLALLAVLGAEALASGWAGVTALVRQGMLTTFAGILGGVLALMAVLLWLQGPEKVHYLLDKDGVHARFYLSDPAPVQLYARFVTEEAVARLAEEDTRPPLEGLTLVRRVTLPWSAIRRVRVWREGMTLLFFRPSCWQALAIRCPMAELPEAEAFVRKRMKRVKKARVLPPDPTEKKKKR